MWITTPCSPRTNDRGAKLAPRFFVARQAAPIRRDGWGTEVQGFPLGKLASAASLMRDCQEPLPPPCPHPAGHLPPGKAFRGTGQPYSSTVMVTVTVPHSASVVDPDTHRMSASQVISSPSHWSVQSFTPMRSSSSSLRSRLDFQKGASS